MVNSGLRYREIKEKLGISEAAISRVLKAAGYKKQTKGRGYRKIKLSSGCFTQCELCGWNAFPALLKVHHKDGDRNNAHTENLLVVCPVCHELLHLTPRGVNFSAPPNDILTVHEMIITALYGVRPEPSQTSCGLPISGVRSTPQDGAI